MAQSNIGGAFGFLRKSIGSIVYSTSTASLSGEKKQVARSKPTSVRNPRTLSQIVQRMKVGPAQLFYAAFEKAAGSVENNPLSHSWQGVPYGPKSRTKFLQLAMTGDPKAYVPKGINFPVPGVYQVSEGSLPNMPSGIGTAQSGFDINVGAEMSAGNVATLQTMGAEVGDQLTIVALLAETNGSYKAAFGRVIIGANATWDFSNDPDEVLMSMSFNSTGIVFDAPEVACAALILSRGTSSATAKRSTAVMTIAPDYANLMSPEAYDAAVDSYITGTTYNSLNSDWYLNQGSSQAFNGEVFMQVLSLAAGEGVAAVNAEFVLGRQSNGGSIVYTIFTSDGTSAGTAYAYAANQISTDVAYTAARVAAALGNVNIRYQQYTEAIGAQAQGNA